MKKKVLLLLCLGVAITLNAQKFKVTQGSLSPLKGETSFNVQFTYENMTVGKKTEVQYVEEKTENYNKKETGRGNKWAKAWVDDREKMFEPKFIELFCKSNLSISHEPQKYTLIFNTSFTEPGWNVGVSRASAYISGVVTIVETENPSNVIAEISVERAPGRDAMGYDFATGTRIAEAYAVTGKKLPKFIMKLIK